MGIRRSYRKSEIKILNQEISPNLEINSNKTSRFGELIGLFTTRIIFVIYYSYKNRFKDCQPDRYLNQKQR